MKILQQSLPKWCIKSWGITYCKDGWLQTCEDFCEELCVHVCQEHYVQVNANWTRDAWAGVAATDKEKQWPHTRAKFPREAQRVTFEQFRHYACLVCSPRRPCT